VQVPYILQCLTPDISEQDFTLWIQRNLDKLTRKLEIHSAILFRGFPLSTASHFNSFVKSFSGWQDLSYEDSLSFAVRTKLVGRVCTTNDGKTGGLTFHHEQAQTPKWPSKVFFFCETPAPKGTGGGTGLSPSDLLLQSLESKFPQFVTLCEQRGVKYTAYLTAEPDPSKGVGRGWKSFFGVESKAACESKMASLGYSWEWRGEVDAKLGELLCCTTPRLRAVRKAPGSGRRVFFNQIAAQLSNAKEWSSRLDVGDKAGIDIDRFMSFGDGSSMQPYVEALQFAKQTSDDNAVEIEWLRGDVALIDNYTLMHARRTWTGDAKERRVLASLHQRRNG
jgi:hypothetical protein